MASMTTLNGSRLDRSLLEAVLKPRLFFSEVFEIYRLSPNFKGDNRGLYDYGLLGTALQTNIVDAWRKHFVLEENFLELDCSVLTPEFVLKTSGHVDKFADLMCKGPAKGEYLRADHLVENVLESRLSWGLNGPSKDSPKLGDAAISEYNDILAKIGNYDGPQLGELITRLDIRNPDGNGEANPPIPFNLMFKSTIGPSSATPICLRPETAQSHVGKAYKNEISPRSGLLQVREFLVAEIEHFVEPENKQHARFSEVCNVKLPLLDKEKQLAGNTTPQTLTVGEVVKSKVVDNETLGYFLGRVMLFLLKIGIDPLKVRFRQHMDNEMAHYACDCWDAELLTSYGWIECVGCADRSAYDLAVHSKYTGTPLVVEQALSEPVKKLVDPRFKRDAKAMQTSLATQLRETGAVTINTPVLSDGSTSVELSSNLLAISKVTRTSNTRKYTPNVIEPSFGIGRILYSLLEQVYWHRPHDAARAVRYVGLLNLDSSSASIGKRYARNDELGTPLGITIDFDTLADGSITLKERDSMTSFENLADSIESWEEISQRLQPFLGQGQED
ncbi:glycyl-tRNA synthetase 1 [Lasiosphaeria miniovina]|uniref:glycine--tRNA ligase n=1 Tax=Lasiosphaeria miniovina TaxID=1954250 RepID=A0AA40B4C1_9PEZI|nr:glycyl-tRNA synthetase 1 [Lasiosphaeria miniovina]KAK0727465.1 glycyl-tRNA synthetase 1 [Lasiosphaeria miniovina]